MDIGRLNKRVTIAEYREETNELNQDIQKLVNVCTVWATVAPTRGKEYQEAQKIRPELTYKVTIRYREGIRPDMVVIFNNQILEIESVINVGSRNEMLELMCVETILRKRD